MEVFLGAGCSAEAGSRQSMENNKFGAAAFELRVRAPPGCSRIKRGSSFPLCCSVLSGTTGQRAQRCRDASELMKRLREVRLCRGHRVAKLGK